MKLKDILKASARDTVEPIVCAKNANNCAIENVTKAVLATINKQMAFIFQSNFYLSLNIKEFLSLSGERNIGN